MSFLVGEPFLAGWGNDTLRLYRKTDDQFVQLSSEAAPKHPDAKWFPRPTFSATEVTYTRDPGNNQAQLRKMDLASPYGVGSKYTYGTGSDVSRRFFMNGTKTSSLFFLDETAPLAMLYLYDRTTIDVGSGAIPSDQTISRTGIVNDTEVGLYNSTYSGTGQTDSVYNRGAFSPNGKYLATARSAAFNVREVPNPPDISVGYTTTWPIIATTPIASSDRCVAWSSDSTWAFCVNWVDNRFIGIRVDGVTASVEHDEVMSDQVVSITSFGPFVAVGVSYEDSGTKYRTHIYKKSADEFVRFITLDGIGADVLFTPDGTLLLDATTRKAFNRSGSTFTEAVGMMSNIAAGTVISNVSWHVPSSFSQAFFYDGVASDILMNTIDNESLKVLLLDSTYNFNKADTLISTVTNDGAREVFGSNWPEGGVALTTVARTPITGGMKISADDVEEFIFGATPIQARSAVIYSGTRPIIFVDFLKDVEIGSGESLIFNMDDGFVVAGE